MLTEDRKRLYRKYQMELTRKGEDAYANAIMDLLAECDRLAAEHKQDMAKMGEVILGLNDRIAAAQRQQAYIAGIIESEGKYVP